MTRCNFIAFFGINAFRCENYRSDDAQHHNAGENTGWGHYNREASSCQGCEEKYHDKKGQRWQEREIHYAQGQ